MSTFIRRLTAVSPARNGMSSLLHGMRRAGASLALALASLALMSQGPVIALLVIFALGAAYYAFHGRYHLVAKSADEEFALLARAEAGLDDR